MAYVVPGSSMEALSKLDQRHSDSSNLESWGSSTLEKPIDLSLRFVFPEYDQGDYGDH